MSSVIRFTKCGESVLQPRSEVSGFSTGLMLQSAFRKLNSAKGLFYAKVNHNKKYSSLTIVWFEFLSILISSYFI